MNATVTKIKRLLNLIPHAPRFVLAFGLVLIGLTTFTHGQEDQQWSRFRGPNGTGILDSFYVPLPWTDKQILHRVDLPGNGNGSPSIWNGVAYLQVANSESQKRSLVAVDLSSGKIKWTRESAFSPYGIHKFSSYASSTPCVDADRVYNVWGAPESLIVEAYSHQGEKIWSRDLGSYVSQHGFGSSPMLVDGLVVVYNSQDAMELPEGVAPGPDQMVALKVDSGEIAWKRDLEASRVCYGVPCVTEIDGKEALLNANTSNGFYAIDVKDGNVLLEDLPFGKRVCCSCSFNDDIFVASEGSGGGGNIVVAYDRKTKKERFRVEKAASYVPTTVLNNDKLFIWSDNGIVSAVDAYTGKSLASKRVGGSYSASPVLLGGKLLNVSHDGVVTILDANNNLNEVGSIELEQSSRASIAATPDKLLIRTDAQLWVIGMAK